MSWPPPSQPPPWLYPRDGIDGELDEENQLATFGLGLGIGRASCPECDTELNDSYVTVELSQLRRLQRGVKIVGTIEGTFEHSLTHDRTHDRNQVSTSSCIFTLIEHREESITGGGLSWAVETSQLVDFDILGCLGIACDTDYKYLETNFPNEAALQSVLATHVVVDQETSVVTCTGSCTADAENDVDETPDGYFFMDFTFPIRFCRVGDVFKLKVVASIPCGPTFYPSTLPTNMEWGTQLIIYTGDWAEIAATYEALEGTYGFGTLSLSDEMDAGTFLGVALKARCLELDLDFTSHTESDSIGHTPPIRPSCGSFWDYDKFDRTGAQHFDISSVALSDEDM